MINEALDYSYSYANFLVHEAYNQEKMAVCINEAIILSEGGSTEDFHVIHEGFTDKIKEIWNKFVRFINKIWLKFKATFDRILDNDRGWCEKYKTIITERPLKLDVSMTNYQPTIISRTHAEHFDPAKVSKMLEGNIAYLKSINGIPSEISSYDGSDDIADIKEAIRLAFCGGSDDEPAINKATFNMTDVYNFVHDYKSKIVDEINKDVAEITKSADQFDKLAKELEAAEKTKEAETVVNNPAGDGDGKGPKDGSGNGGAGTPPSTPPASGGAGTGDPGNTGGTTENSMLMNTGFSSINEISISNSGNGTAGAGDVNKANMAGGVSTKSDTKYSNNANGLSGSKVTKDAIKTAGGFTLEDIQSATTVYSAINGAILSVKQTICQNMYKDYRTIIKAHIQSYVGEVSPNTTGKQGTDFSQGQPPKENKTDKAPGEV